MNNFEEFYENLKQTEGKKLKESWQQATKEIKKGSMISKVVIICIIICELLYINKAINIKTIFLYKYDIMFMIVPIFMMIVIDLMIFLAINAIFSNGKGNREFREKYKNIIVNKLIKNFFRDVEYAPNKEISSDIYDKGMYEGYDRYTSDDYITAKINDNCKIEMGEVLTEEKHVEKDEDGNTHTTYTTIFHGLFAKIELDKSIRSKIKLNGIGYLSSKEFKTVNMDSTEFSKKFKVKATDEIVAMQILTADVMEELVDFWQNNNIEYDVYLADDKMYLRFHTGSMFEARIGNSEIDEKSTKEYFEVLKFTNELVNKLIVIIDEFYKINF